MDKRARIYISAIVVLSLVFCFLGFLFMPEFSFAVWENQADGLNYGWYDDNTKTITIKDNLIFNTLAEYTLTDNTDQCLYDCYAEGKVKINEKGQLFQGLIFKDKDEKETSLRNYTIYYSWYEPYEITILDYKEVCEDVYNDINKTTDKICRNEQVGTHKETRQRLVSKIYDGEEVEPGDYLWRIEGRKDPSKSVDWIASAFNIELEDWAWWNANWVYRTNMSVTNPNTYTLYNYPVFLEFDTQTLIGAGKMNADCSDIRVIDSVGSNIKFNITSCNAPNTNVTIALNMSATSTQNVSIYYGYAAAANAASIVNPYTSDNHTLALYHLNENTGASLTDDTGLLTGEFYATWNSSVAEFGTSGTIPHLDINNITMQTNGQAIGGTGYQQNFTIELRHFSSIPYGAGTYSLFHHTMSAGASTEIVITWAGGAGYKVEANDGAGWDTYTLGGTDYNNTWQNLAFTFNNSHVSLYANGTRVGTAVNHGTGYWINSSYTFWVGTSRAYSASPLDGTVDEIRISDTDDITRLYPAPSNITYTKGQEEVGTISPTVENQAPKNNTYGFSNSVDFIFNTTDSEGSVQNCSLWIYDGTSWNENKTITFDGNQSDGFSLANELTPGQFYGITTNGSDFWVTDRAIDFVYHLDRYGNNQTDGFSLTYNSNPNPYGITTNGSDFWIADDSAKDWVYHLNRSGDNISDGFSTTIAGTANINGITTNGSDFWLPEYNDKFVYHFNASGDNQTDGFKLVGLSFAVGITTNGSDFWVYDLLDKWTYHYNASGDNQTDGFSSILLADNNAYDLTTYSLISKDSATDFWILSDDDDFVYHYIDTEEGENTTFSLLGLNDGSYNWTVSCYDDSSEQGNSSLFNYSIYDSITNVTLKTPKNNSYFYTQLLNFTYQVFDTYDTVINTSLWLLNSGVWTEKAKDTTITESTNQSINITTLALGDYEWLISAYDDTSTQVNSSLFNFSLYDSTPSISITSPSNNSHNASYVCGFQDGETDCDLLKSLRYTDTTFTYWTNPPSGSIDNCSIYFLRDGAWQRNATDTSITANTNQSFNISLINTKEDVEWLVSCYNNYAEQGNTSLYNYTLYEYYRNYIRIDQVSPTSLRYLDNNTIFRANVSAFYELNTEVYQVNFTIVSPDYKHCENLNGTYDFVYGPINKKAVKGRWFANTSDKPLLINKTGEWQFKVTAYNTGMQSETLTTNISVADTLFISPKIQNFVMVENESENKTLNIQIFQDNLNASINYNISAFIQGNYHNISLGPDSTSQKALSGGNFFALGSLLNIKNSDTYNLTFYLNRSSNDFPFDFYYGNVTIRRDYPGYGKNFTFNFTIANSPPASNLTFIDSSGTLCSAGSCDITDSVTYYEKGFQIFQVQNTGNYDATECNLTYEAGQGTWSPSTFTLDQNEKRNITITYKNLLAPSDGFYQGSVRISCKVNALSNGYGGADNPPTLTINVPTDSPSDAGGGGGGGGAPATIKEEVEELVEQIPLILSGEKELGGAQKIALVLGGALSLLLIFGGVKKDKEVKAIMAKRRKKNVKKK